MDFLDFMSKIMNKNIPDMQVDIYLEQEAHWFIMNACYTFPDYVREDLQLWSSTISKPHFATLQGMCNLRPPPHLQ